MTEDLTIYCQGVVAFHAGYALEENPYENRTSFDHADWANGWNDAKSGPTVSKKSSAPPATSTRACYLGPVQRYRLEQAVAPINEAFDSMSYLVGSCLTRPDYRDVDVRLILDDGQFMALFGVELDQRYGQATALWTSLAVTYSRDLSAQTGLNVDFQIQAQSVANAKEPGERHALFVTPAMEPVRERELDANDKALVERAWRRIERALRERPTPDPRSDLAGRTEG